MRVPSVFGRSVLAVVLGSVSLATSARAAEASPKPSVETIIFIRHGEKPEQGLGQLSCQGLNRALALPSVLEAKFGRPDALFAPDPSKRKADNGTDYDYIRPLATIEPTAIRFVMPVDTTYGFAEVDALAQALQDPKWHGARIVVAWEHKLIDRLVRTLLDAHGGDAAVVPKWHSADFDGIDVVTIDWSGGTHPAATFRHDMQGLDGQPTTCPR